MFSLMSGLWKYIFQKNEYHVLILGLDNAGKTTLLEQIKREYDRSYKGVAFEKISATVGLNVGKAETMGIRLLFWDLGGQAELQSMWEKYFAEAHAVVYVIDSTDGKRLHASQQTFDEMISHRLLESVPVLLLANKQDLDDAMSVESIKGVFNASASSVGVRDCKVQPVSAVVGDGVRSGLTWLVERIKRNDALRPPHVKDID